jgi:bifunctional DNA-binding transcriptional regulator/antitoxin component of YhaV-PrlF toxin-antitoxin module
MFPPSPRSLSATWLSDLGWFGSSSLLHSQLYYLLTFSKDKYILLTMTNKSVTITSKNQITIPISMVRDLRLGMHRRLNIRKHGNELILSPEPALEDHLRKIWEQLPPFKGTKSNEDLQQTTKDTWANKHL